MITLALRTESPSACIILLDDQAELGRTEWEAHRQLAATLHTRIDGLLKQHGVTARDIRGIIAFKGPGSFTGLRIGLSVANALAYAYGAQKVTTGGDTWIEDGVRRLTQGESDPVLLPEYGSAPNITVQKH